MKNTPFPIAKYLLELHSIFFTSLPGNRNTNRLHRIAQFALFVSSYLPLFLLVTMRQISQNHKYLRWGGISFQSLSTFATKFGLSFILLSCSAIGLIGFVMTLGNIEEAAHNGVLVTVKDVKNKNSEAIGYIATYIIPFLFESFSGWYEMVSVLFLMMVIYRIYINSSLLLINPLLSLKYAIYEIEYEEKGKKRNGLIISKDLQLQDDSVIKLYEIGHKLFYSINKNQNQ